MVVAHRGCVREFGNPDNSMAALQKAIDLKLYASECDIYITKDDKVVVCHDADFHDLIIMNATYDELRAAGTLSNGEELPLLEDYIDKVLKGGVTRLWVDIKTVSDKYGGYEWSVKAGKAAAEIVRQKKAKNFVGFFAGSIPVFNEVFDSVGDDWEFSHCHFIYTPDQFVSQNIKWGHFNIAETGLDSDLVKRYQDKNIRVSIYNFDTDEQIAWYHTLNNVYACTNYPAKILATLGLER